MYEKLKPNYLVSAKYNLLMTKSVCDSSLHKNIYKTEIRISDLKITEHAAVTITAIRLIAIANYQEKLIML